MSRGKRRQCERCGRTFKGEVRLCWSCRATDRICAKCDKPFRGNQNCCPDCQSIERACIECGEAHKGTNRRCLACRTVLRICNQCGDEFTGAQQPCGICRKTDRTCEECGKTFHGHTLRCGSCRATERECTQCGRRFKGERSRCQACSAVERDCLGCGRRFRGLAAYCGTCWKAALPPGESEARARTYGNNRRARQLAAEVQGPVPSGVYAIIRAVAKCVYCGQRGVTVDHVRPLTQGGLEHKDNLVSACQSCNSSKNDSLLTEWHPDRVAHGMARSWKVGAEYARLTGDESFIRPGDEPDIEVVIAALATAAKEWVPC